MKWKWIDADCTSVTTAEGTLTLKLDVSLVREYVPNYNPNIPGES